MIKLMEAEKLRKLAITHLRRNIAFNKAEGWRDNIKIELLMHLHFFIAPFITKSKLFSPFTWCALIHNWKIR